MDTPMTRKDALESLIDQSTLPEVLADLAHVCGEKAEHLRANWQDEVTARQWEKAADCIDKAAARIMGLGL
jgi:hypothetical protein